MGLGTPYSMVGVIYYMGWDTPYLMVEVPYHIRWGTHYSWWGYPPHKIGYTLLNGVVSDIYGWGISKPNSSRKGVPALLLSLPWNKTKYYTNMFFTYRRKLVMSRTRSHIVNELSIRCNSRDNESLLFIVLTRNIKKSVSSKNFFRELNELSLFAVYDYCSRHSFEFAKFKTISVFIH